MCSAASAPASQGSMLHAPGQTIPCNAHFSCSGVRAACTYPYSTVPEWPGQAPHLACILGPACRAGPDCTVPHVGLLRLRDWVWMTGLDGRTLWDGPYGWYPCIIWWHLVLYFAHSPLGLTKTCGKVLPIITKRELELNNVFLGTYRY